MKRKETCHRIDIPKEVCYLRFGKGKYDVSNDDFMTMRGEMMIIDLDKKGKVIGIELVDLEDKAKKPCQEIPSGYLKKR